MSLSKLFVNQEKAWAFLASVEDPRDRILLELALSKVTMSFIKRTGQTEEEYQEQLPQTPFDLLFYLRLMKEVFIPKDKLCELFKGDLESLKDFHDI